MQQRTWLRIFSRKMRRSRLKMQRRSNWNEWSATYLTLPVNAASMKAIFGGLNENELCLEYKKQSHAVWLMNSFLYIPVSFASKLLYFLAINLANQHWDPHLVLMLGIFRVANMARKVENVMEYLGFWILPTVTNFDICMIGWWINAIAQKNVSLLREDGDSTNDVPHSQIK